MVIFGQPYGSGGGGTVTPPDVSDQIAAYIAAHPFYRTFKSWAELKAAKPTATGERVFLSSYNAVSDGSFHGSGWFTGSLAGKIADDGGVHAADSGKTYFWLREKEYDKLDVTDFGAMPGGTVDAQPAIQRMNTFANTYLSTLGIRFPAGSFLVSGWDYSATYVSKFKMAGPDVELGYMALTTLILDGSADYAFKVQARYTEITGILVYGQYDKKVNTMGFFRNICSAGQYARIKCVRFSYMGGKSLSLIDTLDTKIDQFYSSNTYDSVLDVTYDNATVGSWDHSTALELSNFNLQHGFGTNASIYAPRATQCFIYNGWIEHTEHAGDLSNGQWLIDGLDLENIDTPFDLTYCRASMRGINLINASFNRTNTTVSQWASGYDQGNRQDEAFGSVINGTMKAKWYTGALRGTNNANANIWLNLGSFYTPNNGGIWEIEIISRLSYNSVGSGNYPVQSDRSPGKTIINIQRGAGNIPIVTMYHFGATGVTAAQYANQQYNETLPALWVQFGPYTGEYVINVKSTSPTRFDQGQCALFTVSGATQSASPGLNAVVPRMSLHNGSAGVGAQGNLLAVSTATGTPTTPGTASTHMQVVVNGTPYFVPLFL